MRGGDYMARPLEGLKVLDATQFLSFPFGTMLMAGLGAEVIKVEEPEHGDPGRLFGPFIGPEGQNFERQTEDDEGVSILKRHRGKKSITLNLRLKEGQEIFKEFTKKVDVVTENFAPGVLDRWGLGYEQIKEINPRIVYASISGFGHSGSRKEMPAFDPIAQSMSGFMMTTGFEDRQGIRAGAGVGDMIPAIYAVVGILSALRHLDKTGVGQYIDISMQDSLFSMVMMDPLEAYRDYRFPFRAGNRLYRSAPMNTYKTKDGYVILTVQPVEKPWANFCKAIEREDMINDPRFDTQWHRIQNMDSLDAQIEAWTSKRTTAEALAKLKEYRVPSSEVIDDVDLLLNDQQLADREMVLKLKHPKMGQLDLVGPGNPIKFSTLESNFDGISPTLGQHNSEIYSAYLGYSEEKLAELKKAGII
jgi:crotonobetainyl-CoA:carnitine CoA-transferase CaiB-like acyl-CoA transferase